MLLLAAPTVSVHVTDPPMRLVGFFVLTVCSGSVLQLYGFSMISQFGLGPTIGEIIPLRTAPTLTANKSNPICVFELLEPKL